MALSKRSIEILIDLLEIQEDARELLRLKKCKQELQNILSQYNDI